MAARSIASLTISFGLVSIPVKLYSATETSRSISFNLLHKACGSRLRQQYFCVKEDVPVSREDMAKGYEFAKDQYVMFSPEELKALEEAGTQAADITEFIPQSSIDPVYYDKAYYLGPDKGGAKPYALLARALKRIGPLRHRALGGARQAVHRAHPRGGRRLRRGLGDAAADVRRRGTLDEGHRYSEDGRAGRRVEARPAAHRAAIGRKFDPAAYKDEVRERIEAAVQKKVEGQEITMAEAPEQGAQVIDLMDALRASLEKKPARKPQVAAKAPAAKAPARKAAKK